MSKIHAALALAQSDVPSLKKSATNPHFKSKYIPLEDIVAAADPAFARHDLVFYSTPTYIAGSDTPALAYQLVHLETGEAIADTMPLLLDKQNSQGVGSAITYARRYVLTSLLNIIADVDDDGNKASTPPKAAPVRESFPAKSFTDRVRDTGRKAAEIREWAASEGYTLDDVGVDAKGLAKFLNELQPARQKQLLEWAQ